MGLWGSHHDMVSGEVRSRWCCVVCSDKEVATCLEEECRYEERFFSGNAEVLAADDGGAPFSEAQYLDFFGNLRTLMEQRDFGVRQVNDAAFGRLTQKLGAHNILGGGSFDRPSLRDLVRNNYGELARTFGQRDPELLSRLLQQRPNLVRDLLLKDEYLDRKRWCPRGRSRFDSGEGAAPSPGGPCMNDWRGGCDRSVRERGCSALAYRSASPSCRGPELEQSGQMRKYAPPIRTGPRCRALGCDLVPGLGAARGPETWDNVDTWRSWSKCSGGALERARSLSAPCMSQPGTIPQFDAIMEGRNFSKVGPFWQLENKCDWDVGQVCGRASSPEGGDVFVPGWVGADLSQWQSPVGAGAGGDRASGAEASGGGTEGGQMSAGERKQFSPPSVPDGMDLDVDVVPPTEPHPYYDKHPGNGVPPERSADAAPPGLDAAVGG